MVKIGKPFMGQLISANIAKLLVENSIKALKWSKENVLLYKGVMEISYTPICGSVTTYTDNGIRITFNAA